MTKPSIKAAPEGADAPEKEEIEVTSEMIWEGVSAFFAHDPRFAGEEKMVAIIFREMWAARPR